MHVCHVYILRLFIYSFEIRQRAEYSVLADCVASFSLTATSPNSHKYRFSQLFAADTLPMRCNSFDFLKYARYFRLSCVKR